MREIHKPLTAKLTFLRVAGSPHALMGAKPRGH